MIYDKRKKIIHLIILVTVLNILSAVSAAAASEVLWYYPPTPQGDIGVRRPTVLWTFSGLSSDQIKEIHMAIDGRGVDAVFRDDLNSVYFKPQQSLMPGRYKVSIVVTLKSGVRISSPSFSFNISNKATEEVPATPAYEEVRDRINFYRGIADMPGVSIEGSLNAAADSHASYVIDNSNAGHFESNKKHEHFTGEMPWDRTKYFGYISPMVAENIHFVASHTEAVDEWMNSLYHRLPLINPVYSHMGYGYASKGAKQVNVLEVGAIKYNGLMNRTVVYPASGQTGVPLTWSGLEQPDPLRLYPKATDPGGYPVTLLMTGDRIERLELKSASITEGETKAMDFYSFDVLNDSELLDCNAVALIPKDRLKPQTVYRVSIVVNIIYTGDEQKEAKKEWEFITGNSGFETYRPGDDVLVYVNGAKKVYSAAPFMKKDRVMVPVRSFCESLGAVVNWYSDTLTVEIIKEDSIITFDIEGSKALVNNKTVDIDTPAELLDSITFVPVRFISEILGYNVTWDNVMRMVTVRNR